MVNTRESLVQRRFWQWLIFVMIMIALVVSGGIALAGYHRLSGKDDFKVTAPLLRPFSGNLDMAVLDKIREKSEFSLPAVLNNWHVASSEATPHL